MPARYRPNRRGIGRMLKGPEMVKLVTDAAEHGAQAARAAAPDQTPYGEGLVASIHAEFRTTKGGNRKDRAEARVVADAPYAAAVQFGNKRTVAQPFMNAAITAIKGE